MLNAIRCKNEYHNAYNAQNTTRAIITVLYEWCNDKITEVWHSMDCSVTLAIELVESAQRFVVIRTTIRLVRKSDILPSFRSETNMEECLNCILFFPRCREIGRAHV